MARILYLGSNLVKGQNSLHRAEAFEGLGHDVRLLEAFPPERGVAHLFRALRRRTGQGPAHPVNAAMVSAVEQFRPRVVWVDKGLHVVREAITRCRRLVPEIQFVHYTPDDSRIRANLSFDMAQALTEYDLVVTTKKHNLEYLSERGARRVVMSWKGYDPAANRPPDPAEVDPKLAERTVFVGSYEADRAGTLARLLSEGIPVTVISSQPGWASLATAWPGRLEWVPKEVYGAEYSAALGGAGISLCFLRKLAGDLHTQRSIEIPACGGVMLAERTEEHLALFEEGVEAEFFGSDEECLRKCRELLGDPERRRRMSAAGRRRCEQGGYSWPCRMKALLEMVGVASP